MQTTIPTVKAALKTKLEAEQGTGEALNGVQVTWGEPGSDSIEQECVFIGGARTDEAQATNLRRDENYTIDVWVSVLWPADDAQAAETRLWTLAGAVEDVIDANRRLGNVVNCEVRSKEQADFRTDQGRVANCLIRVAVQARI